ncbi:MAG: hypothetical protein KJ607_09915 [Bacteroidetes bacterium]|nr:hypothetical protein [Bacteroidota bacterium]
MLKIKIIQINTLLLLSLMSCSDNLRTEPPSLRTFAETDTMNVTLPYILDLEKVFGTPYDWKTFEPENVWPNYNWTFLNRINSDLSSYRDEYIIKLIDSKMKEHKRLFVLMGGHHLLKQEPVIVYNFDRLKTDVSE